MFNLIANENQKIYRRMRTWIMVGILLLAIVLVAVVIATHQHAPSANWKQTLIAQDAAMQKQIAQGKHIPKAAIQNLKDNIALNQYYIAHNIAPSQVTGWSFANTAVNLSTILTAFILVVAGDIVASEFSTGTIKMLLTQTATRTKVLTSKFLAMLIYGVFLTAVMLVFSLVVGWIFFGFHGVGAAHVYANAHRQIAQMSTGWYLLMRYGFLMIQIVMMETIAFMVSAIFRSSALAITISLLAFLVGNTLVTVLSSYNWDKYILFANTDLSQFVENGPLVHGLTLSFSIWILVAYFVVMTVLSWVVFSRRDVAYT
ncbi:ABC transporter permease [Alicyclobacillus ferrooxydans]|uniref:ABC transporter permease n=1 Tax=Alicyclobacillus ferrooxydans TaxID=471514 RepID=A0A0P9D2N8_9BACL|nr:ABC transporter permease subunit [Alicyclobacillus ferrooxydans]KPV43778.1 hypothetical protein AN477_10340 [Alicyclobacillus ferrooxydans]